MGTHDHSKKDGYLTGKLLLATPFMSDKRFHKSVIYMCSHDENGAMGLVINSLLPNVKFEEVLSQLPIKSEIQIDPAALNMPVLAGGPVESGRGFLLHSNDFKEDQTITVDKDFCVTGTIEALQAIAEGKGPDDKLFILGYAGWTAGQLDAEIKQNAWLVADPDPALIFKVQNEDKWDKAIASLGFDPGMLSGNAGRA